MKITKAKELKSKLKAGLKLKRTLRFKMTYAANIAVFK